LVGFFVILLIGTNLGEDPSPLFSGLIHCNISKFWDDEMKAPYILSLCKNIVFLSLSRVVVNVKSSLYFNIWCLCFI